MPPAADAPPTDSDTVSAEDVSPEDVRRVAGLARIDFSEEEIETLADDLKRLLGYAQQFDEVDTEGVEPMPPGAPAVPRRLRKDEAEEPLSQKEALENAPDAGEDGSFRTPGALE